MPLNLLTGCLLLAALLASGCANSRSETAEGGPLARQITQSAHCGLTAPGHVHLTGLQEVARLEALPGRKLSLEPLKAVDFAREHVVLVAIGRKPTGGYSVTLESSEIRAKTLDVKVTVARPGPGAVVTQALTTPCAVIAVTAEGWDDIRITRLENNR